ncbi:zinc-dependent alcohol dehydrogenase [Novosphingobium sp. M1R2S20]|uniref:Zinc-binding dehydrogenase n=1 Tax=Novosphingobium rhizovicinum TaxID=3228928 RepID=A0ABV3RC74_9SPHN
MTKPLQRVGRLHEAGRIQLDTAEIPEAEPQDIVVQVNRAGICGTDLAIFRAGSPVPGTVLGHEFSGTVVAAGNRVTGVAAGDRIVANPMMDYLGLGRLPGAFAEYLRLPEVDVGRNVFVLPDTVSDEAGALIEPFAVALHAINRARAQVGERIVIYGAGPIGICVLVGLKARGIDGVLVVEPSAHRREMALGMGASAVHDPLDGSPTDFVASHFGMSDAGDGGPASGLADVAFDCAGVASSLDAAMLSLRRRGRLALVADPQDCPLAPLRLVMLRELEVIGSATYDDEFHEAIDLLASGRADLSALVTHRFPLAKISDAFAMQMDSAQAGKVLIVPGIHG